MITKVAPAPEVRAALDTTILVAYDPSSGGRAALAWALAEGARRRRPLRLVHVWDRESPMPPVRGRPSNHDGPAEAEVRLARVAAEANGWGRFGMNLGTEVRDGSPARVLRDLSTAVGMIVVGNRGHGGPEGRGVGSVARELAGHASCSVVVVRGRFRIPDQRPVVVGVDGPRHPGVVAAAFEEAALRGVGLIALRSAASGGDPATEATLLRDATHASRSRYPGVAVRELLTLTAPTSALLLASQDAQLVVVGARGSEEPEGLPLGSTTESLLCHGRSSMMIVRPG